MVLPIPPPYRLGVVSDDAIAQQHMLDAIHEARGKSGWHSASSTPTTDNLGGTSANQNKGDHVATQSVHRT